MTSTRCDHSRLTLSSGSHSPAGYSRPTEQQRAAATTLLGRIGGKRERTKASAESPGIIVNPASFPGPLLLPNDDLWLDPRQPPQSLRAWARSKDRNTVTPQRNVIYLARSPDVASEVDFVRSWTQTREASISNPRIQDVAAYISAFYHKMPINILPSSTLHYAKWDNEDAKRVNTKAASATPRFIALTTPSECLRIRTRPSLDGIFPRQLNLDDLLDAAISVLPDDAYALLMLVDHDLFEDDDDDFACGRAYGGSRVAVVSTARYNPRLDAEQNVEREHAWPASHCESYVHNKVSQTIATVPEPPKSAKEPRRTRSTKSKMVPTYDSSLQSATSELSNNGPYESPLQAAISALNALRRQPASSPSHPSVSSSLPGLWLSRVCLTASHELGHCFHLDHCVYYACAMQSTASIREDVRQPPYLCPVDLEKVLRATGTDVRERYQALLEFCLRHEDVAMFAAFGAWIRGRLLEVG